MKRIRKWKWLLPVLMILMAIILLKSVLLFGYVPTASMEPTLPKGSYIIGLRLYTDLEKGDIIIFRHDGKLLVKHCSSWRRICGTKRRIPARSGGLLLCLWGQCGKLLGFPVLGGTVCAGRGYCGETDTIIHKATKDCGAAK